MATQKKLSSFSFSNEKRNKIGKILDLEKKYFNIFWNLFTSDEFISDLITIEKDIQNEYSYLQQTWELKNKLKIPAERLVRQYVYKNLAQLVKHIYPSPVSSDCAFITDDAVINLDIKTLDTVGNKNDINNLQFENNQSSFENINLDADAKFPNSGTKVECLLPKEFCFESNKPLPVLSYFLIIVYSDDKESFKLNRDNKRKTIYLKCLPNGFTSELFDYDIITNFKTYTYLQEKHGFKPIYLTNDPDLVNQTIIDFAADHKEYELIHRKKKIGLYAANQIHPKYNTKGVSWFPVSRTNKTSKVKKYYLEAIQKGNTNRTSNKNLINRYDSADNYWEGIKSIVIK